MRLRKGAGDRLPALVADRLFVGLHPRADDVAPFGRGTTRVLNGTRTFSVLATLFHGVAGECPQSQLRLWGGGRCLAVARLDYSSEHLPWHRRAGLRRGAVVVAVVTLAGLAVWMAVLLAAGQRMRWELAALDARYGRVERGMTAAEVRHIMGGPGTPSGGPWYPAWDDELLAEDEAKRITTAVRYVGPRFGLGVVFEFMFDADGRVVGRHRYD